MLAKRIQTAGIHASYDEACKRLLANKQILSWVLQTCVEEFSDCSIQDIEEKYIIDTPEIARVSVHQDELGDFVEGIGTEDTTMTETMKREVLGMCNLSKGIYESGWNEAWGEAWEKARLEDIRNLMETLDISAEKSMDILKIPNEERGLYKKALKEEAVLQP